MRVRMLFDALIVLGKNISIGIDCGAVDHAVFNVVNVLLAVNPVKDFKHQLARLKVWNNPKS